MARRQDDPLRERVLLGIGVVITIVWAIATLAQVLYPDRPVSSEVHLVMLAVAGFFFGGAALEARKNASDDDKSPDDEPPNPLPPRRKR